ncbi:hypothetical protein AMTRI_Chr12g240710 [Amborella trichopoda]
MAGGLLLRVFILSLELLTGLKRADCYSDVNVGLVLVMDSWVGRVGKMCISMALQDFYEDHPNFTTRLTISARDSGGDVVKAASAALDLMKNVQVQAIIGPQTSEEADFVANLGTKSQVPILSFSATSPSLSSTHTPYFIRATPNHSTQAKPIAALFKVYRWRGAVAIYEDSDYGTGFIPYLTDALQEVDSQLQYRCVLPPSAPEGLIREELFKLMTMQTRVFVVHMRYPLASKFFLQVQQIGMMSREYAWIITDGIAGILDSLDPAVIDSMQGVIGVKSHVANSDRLANFTTRWRRRFRQEYPDELHIPSLTIFGIRAYDAAWALALAVEKSGTRAFSFLPPIAGKSTGNSTDVLALGTLPSGPRLRRSILATNFEGLTGNIEFVNGQVEACTFQIINVIGNQAHEVGLWSPEFGLSPYKKISNGEEVLGVHVDELWPVIWPGRSMAVPKGWVIPTNQKKWRVGVPVKTGFTEFVKVERDPINGRRTVTGFSIDVFEAVVESLPYAVTYELIPFEDSHGRGAGTYNDMLDQVYFGNYDAVVGDVSITANRSNYVDFTLPYTESGVTMVVPMKKERRSKALAFLKPLTLELWLITTGFFFLMAFVIWFLEHRINEDFRGPLLEQMGKALYFSFSMLVYSHRDRITSNLTRLVIILWLFVVLILSSSYTANLASIFTVEQLQPTVTDLQTLINNGDYIGYNHGSFVKGLLMKRGVPESKLRPFATIDCFAEALLNGSSRGGVAAIVFEIPNVKLFLACYPDKFTTAGPINRTGGYGFVLPKNSPLLSDISSAVLNITEGEKMVAIENKWFGKQTTQSSSSPADASEALSLDCFWGLFLIVGATAIGALIIFAIGLWNENQNRALNEFPLADPNLWQKIVALTKLFDEKDPLPHNFKTREIGVREIEFNRDGVLSTREDPLGLGALGDVLSNEGTTLSPRTTASVGDAPMPSPLSSLEDDDTFLPLRDHAQEM